MKIKSKKNWGKRSSEYRQLKTLLKKAEKIWISTHLLPDGDGLGAETALFYYLKKAKKQCRIYNPDPIPKRYEFLDSKISIFLNADSLRPTDVCDLWIIVDTNDPRRLGKCWPNLSVKAKKIVFLDHHPDLVSTSKMTYPEHTFIVSDTQSSSIGELLYRMFSELQLVKLDPKIALGLYVSVMTDTNSFRYSRTTPLAHRIAAEMIERGIDPEEVYQAIYSSKKRSHLQLLGQVLLNVQVSSSGKTAWLEMPYAMRKQYQATADDTLSFLSFLLLLKEAEVICFFREEDDGTLRVSLRSKGKVVINRLAMSLGGGGHPYAAGFTAQQPLAQTIPFIIQKIEDLLKKKEKTPEATF